MRITRLDCEREGALNSIISHIIAVRKGKTDKWIFCGTLSDYISPINFNVVRRISFGIFSVNKWWREIS